MKFKFPLSIWLLFASTTIVSSQNEENSLPPSAFSATHPTMQAWEDYFEEKYFSKGIPFDSICEEGTGYLPYLRERHLYDLRKDFRGDAGGTKRWEIFEKMRHATLSRNGPAPAADWQSLGPNKMEGMGGRVISHAFEPGNSQVIWAGSASGGLWLSKNGGESWQPMTDQIPSTGVGAVAVNPLNPNSLLIGTGEGYFLGISTFRSGLGVFKSTDRGLTWQPTDFDFQQSEGVSACQIAWSHADSNTVWLAATNGIWKSTDAGLTWTLKKGDGSNQATAIANDIIQHPLYPDTLIAAIESDGIWRSTDGGENWQKLSGGLPTTDLNMIDLDLCASQSNVIYAAISGGQNSNFNLRGLYRTNNGGDTWTKIQTAPQAPCQPSIPSLCQGWYNMVVAVSPADPELVWLGGVTLWRSQNGGNTWTQHDRHICLTCFDVLPCRTYVDQHDFGFDPADPQTVYAFNDGGVSKSTDGGDCFEPKNEGLVSAQFYAIASGRSDPGTIIGGFQDHGALGIVLSENTGLEWDGWLRGDGTDMEVHGLNPNILYGAMINGVYRRSSTGVHNAGFNIMTGINFNENNGGYWGVLRKHPTDHLTLLGATRQRLYRSTNGGFQWSPVQAMNEPKMFEFDQADPNFAYCAAWDFNGTWSFWRSENGGDAWTQTPNNPGWRVTDIKSSPLQAGLLYVSRNSNLPNVAHIYKSENHGDTWTPIQGDLPDLPVNAIAPHHFVQGVVFAATDLGVFVTCDDGETWTEYNDNLPVSATFDIEFNPADTSLRIGTHGRGAWLTKVWMPEPSPTGEASNGKGFGVMSISPNPASEAVRIRYFLEKTTDVRLEVVNALGQKVASLFEGKQAAGEHETAWNGQTGNGLLAQAGVYFVRLVVGDEASCSKMIWQ